MLKRILPHLAVAVLLAAVIDRAPAEPASEAASVEAVKPRGADAIALMLARWEVVKALPEPELYAYFYASDFASEDFKKAYGSLLWLKAQRDQLLVRVKASHPSVIEFDSKFGASEQTISDMAKAMKRGLEIDAGIAAKAQKMLEANGQ